MLPNTSSLLLFFIMLVNTACNKSQIKESGTQSEVENSIINKNESPKDHTQNDLKNFDNNSSDKDSQNIFDITEYDIVLGGKDAKIEVLEYFSPTCLHCATFHKKLFNKIKQNYIDTGKIKYVRREFISNKKDLALALLSRCPALEVENSYLKLTEIIFDQQIELINNKNYFESILDIAHLARIPEEVIQNHMNSTELKNYLIKSTQAVYPHLPGTPFIVINKKPYQGNLYDILNELDSVIKKAEQIRD